jgi:putative FmdB family regulatory protein
MPPLYEYTCKAGHVTESTQLLAERAEHVKCQTCGKRARRVLSATPGVVKNPAVPRRGQ